MESGYYFILTVIEPNVGVPYEIIPGYSLQKATEDQTSKIKSILEIFNPTQALLNETCAFPGEPPLVLPSPYEGDVITKEGNKPGNVKYCHVQLPQERWRYWIITFDGKSVEDRELRYALSLMAQDIDLGFAVFTSGACAGSCRWHSLNIQTYLHDAYFQQRTPKRLSMDDLQRASRCWEKLKELPKEYDHITRAFRRLDNLRSVSVFSELMIIGLFSVIESLLTHGPKPTDPTDSLIRQIKHKVPLLRKRFARTIDYGQWFNEVNEEKLWGKLYDYRSRIVHGETATISGDLSVLRDRKTVVSFLREIVKLLLIQALEEPVLMTDLKEC